MKDAYHDSVTVDVIKPVVETAAANGTGTDLLGYEGCKMSVHLGASGGLLGASNYITIQFKESSNNTTFSAIADTDLIGGNNTQVVDANASCNTTVSRSYIGTARYVTIVNANTGAVSIPVCGTVEKLFPIHANCE